MQISKSAATILNLHISQVSYSTRRRNDMSLASAAVCLHLYFVRHGETVANREGLLQGHCDYPLTEKGLHGADTVGRYLRNIKWDLMYASDLRRASHTAERLLAFNEVLDVPLVLNPLIREKHFGVRENLSKDLSVREARKIVADQRGNYPMTTEISFSLHFTSLQPLLWLSFLSFPSLRLSSTGHP